MSDASPEGLDVEGEGGVDNDPALPFDRNSLIKDLARRLLLNGRPRDEIARHVNAGLVEAGHTPMSPGSIYRILHYGVNFSNTKERSKRRRQRDQRVVAHNTALDSIRTTNAERQFESMVTAPPGKQNNPLIRTAEQIQQGLVEIMNVPPEVAVTQIPIERCRQWLPEQAAWWSEFARLCEERRLAETPDVPPMRYPKRTKLVGQPIPTQEYQLSPVQATIFAWMSGRPGEHTVQDIIAGTKQASSSVFSALARMEAYGLVQMVNSIGKYKTYEVVPDSAGE